MFFYLGEPARQEGRHYRRPPSGRMRYAPTPPPRPSVSPSCRAVGLSVPMIAPFRETRSVERNPRLARARITLTEKIITAEWCNHFHFYPSRDARTVRMFAFVKTSTADLSPITVSRP